MRTMGLRAADHSPARAPSRVPRNAVPRRLRAAAEGVVATFAEWRRRRRGRIQLALLDDHMLRDIGLSRAEAWYEINKPFWEE